MQRTVYAAYCDLYTYTDMQDTCSNVDTVELNEHTTVQVMLLSLKDKPEKIVYKRT